MIWKLLWWKKPPRKNFVADFWKDEALYWMSQYRAQSAVSLNLKGLIEEREDKIKALRDEVGDAKISVNEMKAQIEAMNTGGHA